MEKYNNYTSTCNVCYAKGWHAKPEKCVRKYTQSCKTCGSVEYGKMKECNGTNVLIDYSEIAKQFIPYYESGQRIEIKTSYGEIKRGTVGKTNGWQPVFLLMARSNSIGSSDTLSENDTILKVV